MMPSCVKCGVEISEEQFQNFDKKCSECLNDDLDFIFDQEWNRVKKGGFG